MLMIVVLLLVDGVTTKTLGSAGTDSASSGAPLAGSAPILVSDGHGGLVSHEAAPGKRIALTLRLDDEVGRNPGGAGAATARADVGPRTPPPRQNEPTPGGALADALHRAGLAADKKGANRTKPR